MRNTPLILGTISFIVLTFLLNWLGKFHFLYIEQLQLFQFTWDYFREMVASPGGFSLWVGEFLTQFFILPYGGPVILALFLTLIVLMCRSIIRRLSPSRELYLLYFLPALALGLLQFDFNYLFQGTIAFSFFLGMFLFFISLDHKWARWLYVFVALPILFWISGSILTLFSLSLIYWIVCSKGELDWKLVLLVLLEWGILSFWGVLSTHFVSFGFVLLPDLYYLPLLSAPALIYWPWILFLIVLLVAKLYPPSKPSSRLMIYLRNTFQFALLLLFAWQGYLRYGQSHSNFFKELDYYVRMEQWDRIIERCRVPMRNYLYLNYLNLALAEKGLLADRLFSFDQHGPEGLIVTWDKTFSISTLVSEVYFTIGQIASSQEMAYKSYVSVIGKGNPRNLCRMVQTNLIFGDYKVAEKYLDILSNTFYYADWAKDQRRFLYNDEAVEQDPLLGNKRRLLQAQKGLANLRGIDYDLLWRVDHKPDDQLGLHYVGAIYLLSKNLKAFQAMIEKYFGTSALPRLPISFQEAVILLAEKNPDYWRRFNVSDAVIQRFASYRNMVLRNRNNPQLPQLMNQSFGDTYWNYFIYKK